MSNEAATVGTATESAPATSGRKGRKPGPLANGRLARLVQFTREQGNVTVASLRSFLESNSLAKKNTDKFVTDYLNTGVVFGRLTRNGDTYNWVA